MMNYLDNLNKEIKEYFKILSKEFPLWLFDYIETPEMQRLSKISLSCGTEYTDLCKVKYWYSNLDHSVGVALIIWHFTHDKKQTLAGLFHDIATPAFKHVIDFFHGDYEKQEATEAKTTDIIKNSKAIMRLLKRDNLKLEDVNDYKKYPIADNDIPQLSADRLEYNFSGGLIFNRIWELEDIRECYQNVIILKNEKGLDELGFKDLLIAEKYIATVSKLWPKWISNQDKIVMQFLADMIKEMINKEYLSLDDLYMLSEQEIIEMIINSKDNSLSDIFKRFQKAKFVYEYQRPLENKYCVKFKVKRRYLVPLVKRDKQGVRINKISNQAQRNIDGYLNIKSTKWTCFDFDFISN